MRERVLVVPGAVASIAILGLAIGAVAALAAVLFVDLVALLNDRLFISPGRRAEMGDAALLVLITILVPALGGLVVGTVHQLIPERRAQGPADVVRAVQGFDGRISARSGLLSALSSIISLGAGASAGQYGPLAHLGATLGSAIAGIDERKRWMGNVGIGCGVASAIATAFNAPLAGIIFAHEVILRHYSLRAFAPITVAATMGYMIANAGFERPPLLQIDSVSVAQPAEFAAFALIGIAGAFVAAAFMRTLLLSGRLAQRAPVAPYVRPMLAGAVLGVAAIWIPEVLGIGDHTVRAALAGHELSAGSLLVLLVAKILATALCIGFGFSGGLFGPSLLIGVLFGALAGTGAEHLFGEMRSESVVYATCGMVAVTSAFIGGPLTAILIVFELTRNYELATAAMVSVVFSSLVSYRLFGRSFFDLQLKERGFDLSLGRDKVVLQDRPIARYVSREYIAFSPKAPVAEVKRRLLAGAGGEGYVIDVQGRCLGVVTLSALVAREADPAGRDARAADLADADAPRLHADTSVWAAMTCLDGFTGRTLPVVASGPEERMLGVVFASTLARAYADIHDEVRRDEHAAT